MAGSADTARRQRYCLPLPPSAVTLRVVRWLAAGEGVADAGEEGADLGAQEDHGDDDDDGDEGDDQRVLDQALALGLLGDVQAPERLNELQHGMFLLVILCGGDVPPALLYARCPAGVAVAVCSPS